MPGLKILGTGSFVPDNIVTNKMLEAVVDTSDDWIKSRTGIRSRHIADGDTCLSMAVNAATYAIEQSGIDKSHIELIIGATLTNEFMTPSLACLLQRELGLRENVLAFDLNAACSGFVYALNLAKSLLTSSGYALIAASEVLSKITNFNDRGTCVLFGDGAGAAIVSSCAQNPFYFDSGAKGDSKHLFCPSFGGLMNPFRSEEPPDCQPYLRMDGAEVFRFAGDSIKKSVTAVLKEASASPDEVGHYVLHQANERIIQTAAKKLGVPIERFFMNIASHGNTSAASIPIALDNLNRSGSLKRGDSLVISGFGGGLTYGSAYFLW